MDTVRWLIWRLVKVLGVGFALFLGLSIGLEALTPGETLGAFQALLTQPRSALTAMFILGTGALFFEDSKPSLFTGQQYEAHCERLRSVLTELKEGRTNSAIIRLEITVRNALKQLYLP